MFAKSYEELQKNYEKLKGLVTDYQKNPTENAKNEIDNFPIEVAIEMEAFIYCTEYPESDEIRQLMEDLDYPVLGSLDESTVTFKDGDYAHIEVPFGKVCDYIKDHKGMEGYDKAVHFMEDEYIADDFADLLPELRKQGYDVEGHIENGKEEAEYILGTLKEMAKEKEDIERE